MRLSSASASMRGALPPGTRMIMCTRASADSDSCTCDSIAVAFSCSLMTLSIFLRTCVL